MYSEVYAPTSTPKRKTQAQSVAKVLSAQAIREQPSQTIIRKIVRHGTFDPGAYERNNPEMVAPNVFSISKIAWDWHNQANEKLDPLFGPTELNNAMLFGRIVGTYYQNLLHPSTLDLMWHIGFITDPQYKKLQKYADPGWKKEERIELVVPYDWQNIKSDCIILIGHIDAINHKTHEIAEFKSSMFSNKIKEYALMQASAYWYTTMKKHNIDYTTSVQKLNVDHPQYVMTRHEKMLEWKRLLAIAKQCALAIDQGLGNQRSYKVNDKNGNARRTTMSSHS